MKPPILFLLATTLALAEPPEPKFTAITLDDKIQIGYGLAIADVDGDGYPDVLLADKRQIVWYRNPGPAKARDAAAWAKFLIAENLTEHDNVCLAAQDLDGDGKCELAVGAEWNPGDTEHSGAVFYLIAPADRTQRWEPVKFPSVEPTTQRMKWVKFRETKSAPAFPQDDGRALANIWSLEAGDGKKELWCGVEPASLFRSEDNGNSWELVAGISNHAHARQWHPGNGGLCMHTIVRDGNRIHLGISTGGHYMSEDGGQTFTASNKGVGAGYVPDPYPEFGQCVHKIARHAKAPGRLYMQNHGGWEDRPGIGVLRSDDSGQSW